jgi:hypothetical protein
MKRLTLSGIAIVAALTLVGCSGNGSTTPTPTTPTATVSSVTVSSPTASATAPTVQLSATARMSDGSTRDVSATSAWSTSNSSLATISATGLLTVVASGEVDVRATFQTVTGTLHMTLTRAPTVRFALSGVVREAMPSAGTVANVRVVLTAGPDADRSTVTDASGFFRLDNISPGVVSMEARKDGYDLWQLTNLNVDADRILDVTLFPAPPKNDAGASATARCNDGTWSWAATRADACTANGGVAYGVCPGPLCDGRLQPSVVIR